MWRTASYTFGSGMCVEVEESPAEEWHKSTHSYGTGNCFEATEWRKATRSMSNGNCPELTGVTDGIKIRDSKDRGGVVLRFDRDTWTRFVSEYK